MSHMISCWLDQIVQIKFGLRPDIWSDLEYQTECLSSLEKYVQIRYRPEFGLRTKSDL